MYCDRCGLNFLPKQSVCTRCRRVPTRYWFQFMSLITILVAVICNTMLGMFVLPRLATTAAPTHGRWLFRAWWWFDEKAAIYGWVPLAPYENFYPWYPWSYGYYNPWSYRPPSPPLPPIPPL